MTGDIGNRKTERMGAELWSRDTKSPFPFKGKVGMGFKESKLAYLRACY